eukprot:3901099-Amphidinium_carterae.1
MFVQEVHNYTQRLLEEEQGRALPEADLGASTGPAISCKVQALLLVSDSIKDKLTYDENFAFEGVLQNTRRIDNIHRIAYVAKKN